MIGRGSDCPPSSRTSVPGDLKISIKFGDTLKERACAFKFFLVISETNHFSMIHEVLRYLGYSSYIFLLIFTFLT